MSRSWSWGIKEYGRTVRVWEERGSRRLYAKVQGQKIALKDLPAGARDINEARMSMLEELDRDCDQLTQAGFLLRFEVNDPEFAPIDPPSDV